MARVQSRAALLAARCSLMLFALTPVASIADMGTDSAYVRLGVWGARPSCDGYHAVHSMCEKPKDVHVR